MNFKVNKKEFYQAMQNIIGVVPVKTTIPILANVLLELRADDLTITGTDLEVSVSTRIKVQGQSDGEVTIPAKVLFDIIRELPSIPMELACDEDLKISLTTDKGLYRLSGEPKEDFPRISMTDSQGSFTIDAARFDGMIGKTIFAVSTDELRTTLMGVYLQVMENELRMVSTDGHRLVKVVDKSFSSPGLQKDAIIPTKALNLLSKNIQENENIKVGIGEDHVVFELDNTIIYCKAIEGQFPSYERVIPLDNDKSVIVDRELLAASVRRVSIFSNSITHQIRLSVDKGELKVQSEDIEFGGEAKEAIDAEYDGEPMDVGYNANYLLDILRHLDQDSVVLKLKDPKSAGIIRPSEDKDGQDILMLLMPIRLTDD